MFCAYVAFERICESLFYITGSRLHCCSSEDVFCVTRELEFVQELNDRYWFAGTKEVRFCLRLQHLDKLGEIV